MKKGIGRVNPGIVLLLVFFMLGSGITFVPPVKGETYVSGIISKDTLWNPSGSPYIVYGNLTIDSGAILTITGDVLIRVDPGVTITVLGGLKVQQSQGHGALFTNNSTGVWGGLLGNQAGAFMLAGCTIRGAGTGIDLRNTSDVILEGVVLSDNLRDLRVTNSSGVVVNSSVNWSRVDVDAGSTLWISNYLQIYVGDMNGPLPGADMEIRDGARIIYATEGFGGNSPKTDNNGLSRRTTVMDRSYIGSEVRENRTFINVTYRGYRFQMREVNMSSSHTEQFVITDPYLLIQKSARARANVSERTEVRIMIEAHGVNNTTAATDVTVIEVLPPEIKYVTGSSTRPVWIRDTGGKVRLQWNISKMNASEVWGVKYQIYSIKPGLLSISQVPPSCVNYTSNLTNKSQPMPDIKVEFVLAPLSVRITSPPPFTIWRIGDRREINWTSNGGMPPVRVSLSYQVLGNQQWVTIARNLPENGSYLWHIPQTLIGIITIRAQADDQQGTRANDTVTVIVIPGFLVVITPAVATVPLNSTQVFTARAIEINGTPIPSDKVLFTWSLGGTGVGRIDPVIGNQTTFTPLAPGTDTLTCIALYEGSPSAGIAVITVPRPPPPDVEVISPGYGDSYPENGAINISWRIMSVSAPFSVNITYSQDGVNYHEVKSGISQPYEGVMNYTWKLPRGLNGSRFIIRVSAADRFNQTGSGYSGEFSILSPKVVRYISGGNQTGDAGSTLAEPLIVQVLTGDLRPVEGVVVSWRFRSIPNGSTIHALDAEEITDSDGFSRATLRLGERAGTYEVSASLDGSAPDGVTFRETAEPGPVKEGYIFPEKAEIYEDDVLTFNLSLYDEYSNPIPVSSVTVNWSVDGVGSIINGTYSSPVPGRANISVAISYKGSGITLHAEVTVSSQDTTTGWILISAILLIFLLFLILIFLVMKRRPQEKPRKIKQPQKQTGQNQKKPPADKPQKKEKGEKKPDAADEPQQK